MGLSLPKSNLIFLKKCLDKWVHFRLDVLAMLAGSILAEMFIRKIETTGGLDNKNAE